MNKKGGWDFCTVRNSTEDVSLELIKTDVHDVRNNVAENQERGRASYCLPTQPAGQWCTALKLPSTALSGQLRWMLAKQLNAMQLCVVPCARE